MSARSQAGKFNAILRRKIKQANFRNVMVDTLNRRGQKASGSLAKKILELTDKDVVRFKYTENKDFNCVEEVTVFYKINVDSPYADSVDSVRGAKKTNMSPPRERIVKWISKKLSNGTWNSPYGKNYARFKVNKSGQKKIYLYPLQGSPKSVKYRKRLAFLIQRSIEKDGKLKNRSPYISAGNIQLELAILSAQEEFRGLWVQELAQNVVFKVVNLID